MRWAELYEMPVGSIDFYGETKPASLRADDIGIVTNEKSRMKMRRVLEKAPLPINLVFLNHNHQFDDPEDIGNPERFLNVGGSKVSAGGMMTRGEFNKLYGVLLTPEPNSITAVFTFNEGTQRRPFTPWMIAHRICHLVEESYAARRGPIAPLLWDLQVMWSQIDYDDIGVTALEHIIQDIGTTKACRDHAVVNLGEFVAECFAQFLVTGKITFKPFQSEMVSVPMHDTDRMHPKLGDMIRANPNVHIPNPEAPTKVLREWADKAEATFRRELDNLKGKIVVM